MRLLILLAYMLLVHLSIILTNPRLAVWSALLLVVLALWRPLMRLRLWAWGVAAVSLALLSTSAAGRWAPLVLFLPPVVVNVALAYLFGHTLMPGQTPLVARIVRLLHTADDIQDPSVWIYARSVTVIWTALFIFNTVICVVMALLAVPGGIVMFFGFVPVVAVPASYWSVFADLGGYVLACVLFIVEYAYRRRRFPWQPYRNFFDFLGRAMAIGPTLGAELWSRKAQPPAS